MAQDSFNRGKRKLGQQDYQGAIEEFDRAAIEDPNNAYIYFFRGSAYSQLRKIKEAIADYDEALKIDSKLVIAYVNRGVSYKRLRKYEQAIADYNNY